MSFPNVQTDLERIEAVRRAMPHEGFFAEKEWLLSPEPFPLSDRCVDELEKLGYRLHLFIRACNLLYYLSCKGKQPAWIADYLDRGKPAELLALSRERIFRDEIPRVIRPDIILTEDGFTIAELDSLPGGIGLTAWFNQVYTDLKFDVVGGADGMLDGFSSIMPEGDILVSREAATYRPEMEWLARQINQRAGTELLRVRSAEAVDSEIPPSGKVYRFFELFDLPNIDSAQQLMSRARSGDISVTPPFKPWMEEKMWFALFWMPALREFWRRELGDRHWKKLQKVIPYTWIIDPTPLPHNAAIPFLNVHNWRALSEFSQRDRELIMKISGFSDLAWGSRGVSLGSDMPHHEWKAAVERALSSFETSPRILQRFHKGRVLTHPYFSREESAFRMMHARVRLCPYYFITDNRAKLSGVLATICPADKKLLHGMRDAILVPCAVAPEE